LTKVLFSYRSFGMPYDLKDTITKYWNERLKRLSSGDIRNMPVSDFTKRFLVDIGLPDLKELSIDLYTNADLYKTLRHNGVRYCIIGENIDPKICIKENADEMFLIDTNSTISVRFINSNIEFFLGFTAIYLTETSGKEFATHEEAMNIVKRLQEIFSELDYEALEDPNNWWSVILEQVEYGM